MIHPAPTALILCVLTLGIRATASADDALVARWPLVANGSDISGNNLHATAHHVDFAVAGPSDTGPTAAGFDGQSSRLVVPDHDLLRLGHDDFTVAAWVFTPAAADDNPGDILSLYDGRSRRGFHLSLKTNAGVTFSQPNSHQLQFGVDQNKVADQWIGCGRPGNALMVFAMCSFDGHLYVGTCEPGRDESGHVYRYAGNQRWIDCGSPDKSNAVTALAEFDGKLYAATGKYRVAGSSLPESENTTPGGRVFQYDSKSGWIDCGKLPHTDATGGLAVFQKKLYATSLYHPPGFFRYDGRQGWEECEVPHQPPGAEGGAKPMRVQSLAPFNGALYGTTYDGGRVFRFDGSRWTDCGQLGDNTQTYSLAVYAGKLHVGTWPSGCVYRLHESPAAARNPNANQDGEIPAKTYQWQDRGRLGGELEVMGMLVHNGRLIAGTLPLAEVYQLNNQSVQAGATAPSSPASGGDTWQKLARLDHTPDVRYRRAWCLAEHAGQVFCSTLPSGKVFSWRAGRVAMASRRFPTGWHHVAAVRAGKSAKGPAPSEESGGESGILHPTLRILIDGQPIAEENGFQNTDFDLSCQQPLQIGFGPNDYFHGRLSDVRLYRRALTDDEIAALARRQTSK